MPEPRIFDTVWSSDSTSYTLKLFKENKTPDDTTKRSQPNSIIQVEGNLGPDYFQFNLIEKTYPKLKGSLTCEQSLNGKNIYISKDLNKYFMYDERDEKFIEVGVNGAPAANGKSYSDSELLKAIEEAKQAKKYTNNDAFLENSANYDGGKVYTLLHGATDNKYYKRIDKTLRNIDEYSVVGFLRDYYLKSGYTDESNEWGLLAKMDTEHDNNNITMPAKKNVVESLLKVADKLGMQGDTDYREIKDIMSFYESGEEYADRNTFRGGSWKGSRWRNALIGTAVYGAAAVLATGCVLATIASGGTLIPILWGAGAAAAAGGGIAMGVASPMHKETDSKKLDAAMYSLCDKIANKLGLPSMEELRKSQT